MPPGPSNGDDEVSHVVPVTPGDRVSEVVLEATSAVSGHEQTGASGVARAKSDRLYDRVDPDALDRLFRGNDGDVQVTFTYAGCEVTIVEDSHVVVRPLDEGTT